MAKSNKLDRQNVEDIFSLTSTQEGMLYHYINAPEYTYFEQLSLRISGEINPDLLKQAWQFVAESHEMLRVVFRWDTLEKPIQVVLKQHTIPMRELHLQSLPPFPQKQKLEEIHWKDRQEGIDIERAPFRLTICYLDDHHCEIILSYHHILFDGWSTGLILRDFLTAYQDLYHNVALQRKQKSKFKEFVKWLESADKQRQSRFWKHYLQGVETKPLSACHMSGEAQNSMGYYGFDFNRELTGEILALTQKHNVTVATFLYSVWGVLLGKYIDQDDLLFGTTVSGRNPEIKGIEEIVGLFINTIPLRVIIPPDASPLQLLQQMNENLMNREPYAHTSLVDIKTYGGFGGQSSLFDSLMVIDNYPIDHLMQSKAYVLAIDAFDIRETTNYPLTLGVTVFDGISFTFAYDSQHFDPVFIWRVADHFVRIAGYFCSHLSDSIQAVEIISETEKEELLFTFNHPHRDDTEGKTLHRLFEEQVERTPEEVAFVFAETRLTYRALNTKANQLARLLCKQGIKPGCIVGMMMERSPEMVIGLLGILKAGGAYLPIDPKTPGDRVRYLAGDSGIKLLLTNHDIQFDLDFPLHVLTPREWGHELGSDLNLTVSPDDPAYMIYTSGSTGNPKGVLVEHGSITNTITWRKHEYQFGPDDRILLFLSYAFDAFITNLFTPLVSGARVVLAGDEEAKDPVLIKQYFVSHQITYFSCVPTFYQEILAIATENELKSVKMVTLGGEKVHESLILQSKTLNPGLEIINEYGPTECSVIATICRDLQPGVRITIGKPIANTAVYIVDHQTMPKPVGVWGEMCISGRGLARGYWNRPELTAEKFLPNPFLGVGPDPVGVNNVGVNHVGTKNVGANHDSPLRITRLYKTGDRGRWLPDGNIEFLGRMDDQIKLHGYRIELGEIEARLLQHELVQEAVVVVRKVGEASDCLCAYFVADNRVAIDDLRGYLRSLLPEYMVPAYFTRLDSLPLMANGKTDRKSLPEPNDSGTAKRSYTAPQDEMQIQLAEIWQEVLGITPVGIYDHFFEMGGDSIKAIQVAARLYKRGLKLEMKDLFQHPRIHELSPFIRANRQEIDQGPVEGAVPLTPIQRWFFEHYQADVRYHFNQGVMLYRKEGFDETILREVFLHITIHHDALRMVFPTDGERIYQTNRGLMGDLFQLDLFQLSDTPDIETKITMFIDRIQQSFDLETGPLLKAGLFKTGRGDHLFMVIHHLVVDWVSWRIIIEDIITAYQQVTQKTKIELPAKTTSFQTWSERLETYRENADLLREIDDWKKIEAINVTTLPKDHSISVDYRKDSQVVTIDFPATETEQLLTQAHQTYHTGINDLLLTALGLTFHEWVGTDKILIDLEGHGREEIFPEVDITRTVGWFTSFYPVILNMDYVDDLGMQIKTIKEDLRRIPQRGIGYGILRYLTPPDKPGPFPLQAKPEICFNYVGQFSREFETDLFTLSPLPTGEMISPGAKRPYPFDISGMVIKGQLSMRFEYNRYQYRQETVQMIAANFQRRLRDIVRHCLQKPDAEKTPSDFSYKDLDLQEMETVFSILEKKLKKDDSWQ